MDHEKILEVILRKTVSDQGTYPEDIVWVICSLCKEWHLEVKPHPTEHGLTVVKKGRAE